jgi:hypothetical protein
MIGLCFEGDTPCSSCSSPLPMNALVENIVCTQCMTINKFTVDDWKDLLEDMLKTGPTFQENEGQPSSIMGGRNYKITYGRQNPKFLDSKTYIDMEKAISDLSSGKVINPETQVAYSIRKLPEKFATACPNVQYLVGEDFTLLPNYNGASVLDNQQKKELVSFTCPNCAGTMQIDGSARLLKCQHCSTESYIPDETWQKMHPAKAKTRFYFWYDELSVKFDWDSDLNDCIADQEGTLYMSVDPIFGSDDELWIVALNQDLTVKWKRNNLKFKTTTGGGEAKLGLNAKGELMVWSGDRNTMLLLSTKDGSDIKKIGKKNEDADKTIATVLDFKSCIYIAGTKDGKYFLYANRDKGDNSSSNYEFLSVDEEGNILPPWALGEPEKKGFFGSLKKAFSTIGDIPYFDKLGSKPTRCKDYEMKVSVGADGSHYLLHYDEIIKLDAHGKYIYYKKVEGSSIRHRIVGDAQGNAYFLVDQDKNETAALMKISPDGNSIIPFIKGVLDGGYLCDENKLAIGGNGIIYCTGYGGRMRIFNPDGTMIYASEHSLEDEKDKIKEKEEMED